MRDFHKERTMMVEEQLCLRGIRDPKVLSAFKKVRRHEYVLPQYVKQAYVDAPLPIEAEQTISQPYIVALMMELLCLQPHDRVLEIGTGSGYQTALLAEIVAKVVTIECVKPLYRKASKKLSTQYDNIVCILGDGSKGYPQLASYDKIIVSAAAPEVPKAWMDQLKLGGWIVVPVGTIIQKLVRLEKVHSPNERLTYVKGSGVREKYICDVRFVPLV